MSGFLDAEEEKLMRVMLIKAGRGHTPHHVANIPLDVYQSPNEDDFEHSLHHPFAGAIRGLESKGLIAVEPWLSPFGFGTYTGVNFTPKGEAIAKMLGDAK